MAYPPKTVIAGSMIERTNKRKALVQATAKSISQRFADMTDFETVGDLEAAIQAAQQEVKSINPLLMQLAQVGT